MTRDEIWKEFDRMQKAIMDKDSLITRDEFFSETELEQKRLYHWMCCRCDNISPGPPWYYPRWY